MTKLRWLLVPLGLALMALAVACGGDDKDDSESNRDNGSSGAGAAVSTELDLSNAATGLLELRSFRFDVALKMDFDIPESDDPEDEFSAGLANAFMALLSDIKMKGAYVAPDSYDISMRLAGEDVRMIKVGPKAWINEGSGWTETDADFDDLGMFGDPSDLVFDMLPQEVLRNAKTKSEKVNGVETTRYSFDKQALAALASDLGEDAAELDEIDEAKLDVWMTRDNIPVRMVMDINGTGEDGSEISINIDFNITDLNSNKIKIEAPI